MPQMIKFHTREANSVINNLGKSTNVLLPPQVNYNIHEKALEVALPVLQRAS